MIVRRLIAPTFSRPKPDIEIGYGFGRGHLAGGVAMTPRNDTDRTMRLKLLAPEILALGRAVFQVRRQRDPELIALYPLSLDGAAMTRGRYFKPGPLSGCGSRPATTIAGKAMNTLLLGATHCSKSALGGGFNGSLQHRVQSIGGAFEAQGLSRTLVQAQGNLVEMGLGEV